VVGERLCFSVDVVAGEESGSAKHFQYVMEVDDGFWLWCRSVDDVV